MAKHIIDEAKRCLNCKKPQCRMACPISTDVPGFIQKFLNGDIVEAGKDLFENNPLSVICSIVCPHEEQCEGGCILGRKGKPVRIGSIENYISDYYLNINSHDVIEKKPGRVAIIGSGPAGLAAAFILARKGYKVTIFESEEKIGGVLRYGIPEFRLSNDILDTLHEKLINLGVKIRPNTLIGPVITIDMLFRDEYDVIFIATGVWNPNPLNVKGESLGHIHYAISYLKNPDAFNLGEKVVVIGGGNTAIDVARTAARKGAKNVTILYRRMEEHLPATKSEIEIAKLDGVKFEFLSSPIEFMDDKIKCIKNEIVDGRVVHLEGREFFVEADSVLIAISQSARTNIVSTTEGIELNEKGLLQTDENGMTTRPGVFGAGDVVTGAQTVVKAVNYTKKVCDSIEKYIDAKYAE